MSMMQLASGGAVVAGLLTVALQSVLPEPAPIVVHDLHYEAGIIYQERTVRSDGPAFFAEWSAQIVDAQTGDPVPWCTGSGSWAYKPGRDVYPLMLHVWTGRDECTPASLLPGTYYPVAVWSWGDEQTSHRGDVFTVE